MTKLYSVSENCKSHTYFNILCEEVTGGMVFANLLPVGV